ncbi:MAG TPA: hypothetical protein VIM08_08270 [Arthrobacter sp.]|jgi:hypothetical protein
MARDRANINTNIWTDQDWRNLPGSQQLLYLLLTSHPTLSYAGVVDWREARLAAMTADATPESIRDAAEGLQAERFVFIDDETEEILVRSFLRHDGLLKQPKLSISMVNAYGAIASPRVREVVTFELQKLHKEHGEWAAFGQEKVLALVKGKGTDMAEFTLGFTPTVTPLFRPTPAQADPLPTTTATTTSTSSKEEVKKISTPNRKSSCPQSFPVTDAMAAWAKENNIKADLKEQTARFLDHHASKGSTFVDWTRAWQNWMRNSKDWAQPVSLTNPMVPAQHGWANR